MFRPLSVPALRWLRQHAPTPFALFLLAWLLAFVGSSAFFALYPVLIAQLYGVPPRLAARLRLLFRKRAHDEDRAGRIVHHTLRHTANKDVGQTGTAVRAHHNQLTRMGLRYLTDDRGRVTAQ